MMRIYIVEDEPPAAAKLELFLKRMPDVGSIRIFHDGMSVLSALADEQPDLMFLDIEMPGISGLDLLPHVHTRIKTQVIITSAYEKYALTSFNFNVTDYLLKPYTFDRLRQAVEKAKEAIRLLTLDAQVHTTTISIRTDCRTEIIDVQDIIYIEALKDYVRIVTSAKKMLTLSTLSDFMTHLPPDGFVRVHRSFVINTAHLSGFDKNTVTLDNGANLCIGKTYKEQFEEIVRIKFKRR